jgi:hypothetical protein
MSILVSLLLLAADPLATTAETSGWKQTGRYDEVERLCAAFPKRFAGKVKCEKFGVTPEGRPMLALIASADGTFEPAANVKKQRPVVLMESGIHAGEIDGKDAGFWLLRQLLDGKQSPGLLSRVTFVFVPVFNVDGHERFGPNQRPNQNGPEQMGWRVTSQNLNLNRDWMKAEAPEMQAMIRLLLKYDPILFADLHVTDGAKFQPDLGITLEPRFSSTRELNKLGVELSDALMKELVSLGHMPLDFYPSFDKDDEPLSGFGYGVPPPRFSQAYWSAHHRFGVLVETHSWKDYATRVKATYDTALLLLEHAAGQGAAWRKAAQEAEAADLKQGGEELPIAWDSGKATKSIDFQGYAYTQEESAVSGKTWVRYDDTTPKVWKEQLRIEVIPAAKARVPKAGWLVMPGQAAMVGEKLRLHGFTFETLTKLRSSATVQTFRVTKAKFRPTPYEGRLTVGVQGEWKDEPRDVPPGALLVPSAQAHVGLLLHLLEPTAPDSLMSWGFFNAHLEQKEYLEDYLTEGAAREMLKDPKVMAEFNARLKDPDFARNPDARLAFFSSRHPSFDERFNLYPVFRTDRWDK